MYCSKCGTKRNENDKFCAKCGNQCPEVVRPKTTDAQHSQRPTAYTPGELSNKTQYTTNSGFTNSPGSGSAGSTIFRTLQASINKRVLIIAGILIVTLVTTLVLALGNRSDISGTWEVFGFQEGNDNYKSSIVFSGRNYTLTLYDRKSTLTQRNLSSLTPPIPPPQPPLYHPLLGNLVTDQERTNMRVIGTYSRENEYYYIDSEIIQIIAKGTFSITNDKIEFITSDNRVIVENFEITENTLSIYRVLPNTGRVTSAEFVRAGRNR